MRAPGWDGVDTRRESAGERAPDSLDGVTLGIPGRAAPGSGHAEAHRSHGAHLALRARGQPARRPGEHAGGVIDVRADAWGHGAHVVAPAALAAGADAAARRRRGRRGPGRHGRPARLRFDGSGDAPEAVYGLSPGFAPVLSLRGRVLSLKRLRAGEGVSYGYTHRASRDTAVALVTGGYAQGVVRALGNAAIGADRGASGIRSSVGSRWTCASWTSARTATVRRGDEVVFFGGPDARVRRRWRSGPRRPG